MAERQWDQAGPSLAQFVQETLVQIYSGVEAAAKQLSPGTVNPPLVGGGDGITDFKPVGETYALGGEFVTVVNFDVAVTTVSTKEGGGGFSLRIPVAQAGLNAGRGSSESNVSRVAFKVPLKLPSTGVRTAPSQRKPMDRSRVIGNP